MIAIQKTSQMFVCVWLNLNKSPLVFSVVVYVLLKKAECPINVAVIAFLPLLSMADGAFSLLQLLDEKNLSINRIQNGD